MADWELHLHGASDVIEEYRCGLKAGQRVSLRKDLVICNHLGTPTGKMNAKGEVWQVLPGTRTDPVLWFRDPDGCRHTWDDDVNSVAEWFEIVDASGN